MNIKKLTMTLAAVMLFAMNAVQVQAGSWGVGVKIDMHSLDSDVSEDIDSNGTVNERASYNDKAMAASVFVERNIETGFGNIALGVNYVPFEVDIDKRSISQSSVKAVANGAATTGTNYVKGTVSNHYTVYVQPGFNVGPNLVYLNFGLSFADVEGSNNSISSTNITSTKNLEGTQIGIGLKKDMGDRGYLKLEYSETDYDQVSWTTSNSTKGMADLDDSVVSLSLGKEF